jgi:hypothetical protein
MWQPLYWPPRALVALVRMLLVMPVLLPVVAGLEVQVLAFQSNLLELLLLPPP